MKLEIPPYLKNLRPRLLRFKRSLPLTVFLLFVLICGGLVLRIGQLSRIEPTEDSVTEKLSSIKRPKVDAATLNKIQQLQDKNVDVKTLFDQARNNPFSE